MRDLEFLGYLPTGYCVVNPEVQRVRRRKSILSAGTPGSASARPGAMRTGAGRAVRPACDLSAGKGRFRGEGLVTALFGMCVV